MTFTLKYYPKNFIKLEELSPILMRSDNLSITTDTPLWMTGKLLVGQKEIGFLFTDEGSFAFVLKEINSNDIEYIKLFLSNLGFKCFVDIKVKVRVDKYDKNFEETDLQTDIADSFEQWYDIKKYGLIYNKNDSKSIEYFIYQLSDKEKCLL